MVRYKIIGFVLLAFLCALATAQSIDYAGYLPEVKVQENKIVVQLDQLANPNDFYIYYRTNGLKKFQVRKMKISDDGKVFYQLSKENLYGKHLEYFILEDKKAVSDKMSPVFTVQNFTGDSSPEVYFLQTQEGETAETEKKGTPFYKFIRTNASLSNNSRVYDQGEYPLDNKGSSSGNLSFSKNVSGEKYEFDFKSDFSYIDPVYDVDKESKFNLTSMNAKFRHGRHHVELGDLYVSDLDFTTSSINKRGLSYQFKGKQFMLGSFFTNSQQKTKFEGFGLPPADANLFGAMAGFHIGDEYSPIFKLRGMILSGSDNLDSKTVVSTEEERFSQGTLFSLFGALNLLKNHIQLKGEYVNSQFGKAMTEDEIAKEGDSAWYGRVDFNYKALRGDIDYREIGSSFSSIANLFFQNDNKGLGTNLYLTINSFTLHTNYTDKYTNLLNTEFNPMLHDKSIRNDFSWYIANKFSLGGEFSLNNLDYDDSTGLQTGNTDMDTITYSGNVGYRAGNNGITIRLGKTESKTFTSNIDGSVSVNLMFGKVLRLDPQFTYQSTENFTDDSTSKIYNLFISSELTFKEELLSLTMTASYRLNENSLYGDDTTLSGTLNLNFYMSKIFQYKLSPSLILKTRYDQRKVGEETLGNLTLYLQADISF